MKDRHSVVMKDGIGAGLGFLKLSESCIDMYMYFLEYQDTLQFKAWLSIL